MRFHRVLRISSFDQLVVRLKPIKLIGLIVEPFVELVAELIIVVGSVVISKPQVFFVVPFAVSFIAPFGVVVTFAFQFGVVAQLFAVAPFRVGFDVIALAGVVVPGFGVNAIILISVIAPIGVGAGVVVLVGAVAL